MDTHELAKLLLEQPNMPLALHVNNHTYMSAKDDPLHSSIKLGFLTTCYGEHLVIGNFVNPDINKPNWYVREVIYDGRTLTKKDIIPIKPKPKHLTIAERDYAIRCLIEIYNPIRQKEYAQQFYDYVVDKVKKQAMPDDVAVELSSKFITELTIFKNHLVKSLVTGHKYYQISDNKSFMDMIDIQFIAEDDKITIQPNSVLEVLMHGVAPVKFFTGHDVQEVEELWEKHKHQFS